MVIHAYDHSISTVYFKEKWVQSFTSLFSIQCLKQIYKPLYVFKSVKELIKDTINYIGFLHFFNHNNDIHFYQQGLSDHASGQFITPDDLFDRIDRSVLENDSVFIKMDIEGFEYEVCKKLLVYAQYINGIVIEFHDIVKRQEKFILAIDQLKQFFTIIHVHANNFGGYYQNTSIPNDLEITFMKSYFIKDEERQSLNTKSYPIPLLDVANDRSKPDLPIEFI